MDGSKFVAVGLLPFLRKVSDLSLLLPNTATRLKCLPLMLV